MQLERALILLEGALGASHLHLARVCNSLAVVQYKACCLGSKFGVRGSKSCNIHWPSTVSLFTGVNRHLYFGWI